MLVAELAVVGGHAHAVVRVLARLHLVDQVANGERVGLRRAKNQGLFALVDHVHEQFDAVFFALFDLDDAIEFGFGVAPAFLDLALDDFVVGRVDVIVERGGDLLDLEGRQIAVVDAFLQRIDVNRLAEIGVGVGIDSCASASPSGRAARRAQKYSRMPRQLLSSFAPPRWHSSMTMKSKKSGG